MSQEQTAFPGTISPGDPVSATDNNLLPGGAIGRDTITTDSAGTTTIESVLSTSPDVGANRTLRITACVTVRSTAAGGAQCSIFEDGVQIQRKNVAVPASGTDISWTVVVHSNPSAGNHTYEVFTGASGGGGHTVTCIADGGAGSHGPSELYVDDMGNTL